MALTTRQKLKEHFSSSRREAVRPLVVKQTEYPNREKTARCGKSSKIFLFSVRTILLFSLVAHQTQMTFTFQDDRARSFLCLLLSQRRVNTQKSTGLQRHHSLRQHYPNPCHVWTKMRRVQGYLEGKVILELTFAFKVGGRGWLFVLFKESNQSIYQSISQCQKYLYISTAWPV